MINSLTVDVEEYFHPTEVSSAHRMEEWPFLPSRVEAEMDLLLELLDARQTRATFFLVGWIARRRPAVARRIVEAGHEIGCHSYAHRLVTEMRPREFKRDTQDAASAIADACGVRPRVYRAPSYSVVKETLWALETLVECGFTHDSSIYPVVHDRYGIPGFERFAHTRRTPAGPILEVPVATVALPNGAIAPAGGGGYLRLLPYRYMAAAIRRINALEKQPACVYLHPWELDPEQPRLDAGFIARLRTYTGLSGMPHKLRRLLSEFQFSSLSAVYPAWQEDEPAAASPHFSDVRVR
jgi:polysaccharide deacetylase family protein (PEP-CTERM system associated)